MTALKPPSVCLYCVRLVHRLCVVLLASYLHLPVTFLLVMLYGVKQSPPSSHPPCSSPPSLPPSLPPSSFFVFFFFRATRARAGGRRRGRRRRGRGRDCVFLVSI